MKISRGREWPVDFQLLLQGKTRYSSNKGTSWELVEEEWGWLLPVAYNHRVGRPFQASFWLTVSSKEDAVERLVWSWFVPQGKLSWSKMLFSETTNSNLTWLHNASCAIWQLLKLFTYDVCKLNGSEEFEELHFF